MIRQTQDDRKESAATNNRNPPMHTTKDDLHSLTPCHDSFVGVDSDGCVFDTMTEKQCNHFFPLIIKHWQLEPIASDVRRVAGFINLRSKFRGQNRFTALLLTFDMLREIPAVAESGIKLPETDALRAYCTSGLPLGNASLAAEVARTGDAELRRVLDWSLAVNDSIARHMPPVAPFPSALASLALMQAHSDVIVVSQTPEEALVREWQHHDIARFVRAIAGQELGKKSEHITLAAKGKYAPGRILLIGDAPGDLTAARDAGVLFYPIMPGDEENSWREFKDNYYPMFLAGEYARVAESLAKTFSDSLPETME